ncbi:MAG: endolytic transglycosylase MltG [Gammaproteobacteria bacterium]|nr:endolytic transglycosylase MltG [Gammaproteobacteria bacterium]
MTRGLRALGLCLLVAVAAAVVTLSVVRREIERAFDTPLALTSPVLFHVARGQGVAQVGRALEAEGWIADHRLFSWHTRMAGLAGKLQAGTYEVAPGDSLADLLQRMITGKTKVFAVRFIEGIRFGDVRAALAAARGMTHAARGMSDGAILDALGLDAPSPEGLFFPATYHYDYGTRDLDILARAARRMHRELDRAWAERAPDLPYQTPYDALVMASIIEKETGVASERATIAGVFVRRLEQGMKLQTDPTVIYGLGNAFDGNLTRADLQRDTPYNTYTRRGLPPTPIALPGRAAIVAALNPAPGTALYFVANGEGGHHFSDSLREHNAAVRRYQLSH